MLSFNLKIQFFVMHKSIKMKSVTYHLKYEKFDFVTILFHFFYIRTFLFESEKSLIENITSDANDKNISFFENKGLLQCIFYISS